MNFYLDTGVVFGYGYKDDSFCSYSERLTKKYPFKKNFYYSNVDILNNELNNLYKSRIGNKTNRLIRMVQQKVRIMLDNISDISYQNHQLYPGIYSEINNTLEQLKTDNKPKNYDTIHLTTAHIWDYESQESDCYFITTDRKDICNNKEEIQRCVMNMTNCDCNLKIEHLIDFTMPFGS